MARARRSDRISPRDLEVLGFIGRFGVVPRSALAIWAGTARTVTIERESRLRRAGLIAVRRGYGEFNPLSCATRPGLLASGRGELRPPRFSPALLGHEVLVAEHAASLESVGQRLLSEREIQARERAAGAPQFSALLDRDRLHRADLIQLSDRDEPPVAVEIELSTKGAARLDELLRAWRRAVLEGLVSGVVYRCNSRTLPHVRKAVERTKAEGAIRVEALSLQ